MTFTGELLKEKRRAAEMSQKDVSDRLGFTTAQYISNCERGLVSLAPTQFKPVAKILSCDPKEFFRAHMKDYETKVKRASGLK